MTSTGTMNETELRLLTEVASKAFAFSNKTWLALMAVALVILLPHAEGQPVTLPFALGTVTPTAFHAVAVVMLVAVTLAFACAHAQAYRAYLAATRLLDATRDDSVVEGTRIHPRDLYDLLTQPTINRVGPLAQLLRGAKYQFFPDKPSAPAARQFVVNAYYVLLKLVAFTFYFVVPSAALLDAFRSAALSGVYRWLGGFGVLVAAVALAQIMVWELTYTWTVVKAHVGARRVV